MARLTCCVAVILFVATPVLAEQYWIAYEGNELPENVGWTRYWGNREGEYKGPGAYRTIKDSVITYDSLYDPWVYDFNYIKRPGKTDPGPGELFVMEWRLLVEEVRGHHDPSLGVLSDTAKAISFDYTVDTITSGFDPTLRVRIEPRVFHSYRMHSTDMIRYSFYIDGRLAHTGTFWQGIGRSRASWGDAVQPAASLHHWDYLRFGVIPEPGSALMLLVAVTGRGLLRR